LGRGIRQGLVSTPTPGAFSTILRSMPPIVSSMAGMIPVSAPKISAHQAEWAARIPRERRSPASVMPLALAERIAHPFTLSLALIFSSLVHLDRREARASPAATRSRRGAGCGAAPLVNPRTWHIARRGLRSNKGAVDEAIARIREGGVTNWTRLRRTLFLVSWFGVPGRGFWPGQWGIGRPRWLHYGNGIGHCGVPPASIFLGMRKLHRLTGTVLLAENKLDEGQASPSASDLHRASPTSEIAGIGAPASLGPAVWGEQGRRAEAPQPPRPCLTAGFTEASIPPI